jgi:hypothetical protein
MLVYKLITEPLFEKVLILISFQLKVLILLGLRRSVPLFLSTNLITHGLGGVKHNLSSLHEKIENKRIENRIIFFIKTY